MEMNTVDILRLIALLLVIVAGQYLIPFIKAKTAGTRYENAVDAVLTAVLQVKQDYVDTLKAAGTFTEAAQKEAFTVAKNTALSIMDAATKKWLEKTYDNIDVWLKAQIESAVATTKTTSPEK